MGSRGSRERMLVWVVPEIDPKTGIWKVTLETLENMVENRRKEGEAEKTAARGWCHPISQKRKLRFEFRTSSSAFSLFQPKGNCPHVWLHLDLPSVSASLSAAQALLPFNWCGRQWAGCPCSVTEAESIFLEFLVWVLTSYLCACSSLCFRWSLPELL